MIVQRIRKLAGLLRHPAAWRALFLTRTAAAIEHDAMLRYTRPDLVIDVGANKGQFALAARPALPVAKVLSFEPLESEARKFQRNFLGTQGISLHQFAIGREQKVQRFHIGSRPDSSSLLEPGDMETNVFGVFAVGTMTVSVRRLDEVLTLEDLTGRVLLKIDVQGAEGDVIAGASALLPAIRFVYAEASFVELYKGQLLAHELIELLNREGFCLRGIYNQHSLTDLGPVQADLLFENVRVTNR